MSIGDNIKKLRKEKNYTQKQLAEMSGIATITLQQYELGKRTPQTEQLIKLSSALQVDINSLLEDSDSPMLKAMKSSNSPLYEDYKKYLLSHSVELENIDIEFINDFHKLNSTGQKRLLDYLSDLLKIEEYKKDTP
jgi:transcriptional regulator with XRE-family HTH domain